MADSTNELPPGAASAGAILRAAREKQGLHIAALAAAIKVAPRKLDALENDRWAELPDATFARALAQTVCRTLKIDARPVLALLPTAGALALEPPSNVFNEPFRERPGRDDGGFAASAIRPMVWAAGVLMLAAVVVYFAPLGDWSSRLAGLAGASRAASAAAAVPASAASAALPPVALAAADEAASAAQAASGAAPGGLGSAPASIVPAGETVFSAPPPATLASVSGAGNAQAALAAPPAASGIVQLRSTEPAWVDVRDARGAVLFSRTVLPGEAVGLDGNLPIRLVIGNAAATQLEFRGRPVELQSRTRENVARVELQ